MISKRSGVQSGYFEPVHRIRGIGVIETVGEALIASVEDRSTFGWALAIVFCFLFAVVAVLCWRAGNIDGATVFLAAAPGLVGLRVLRSLRRS
jgi:uncharacterized membrane protein AbrB (regulator of aidB expression)